MFRCDTVGDTVKIAIDYSGKTVKAIARECGYSNDAIYSTINGLRPIPTQARESFAKLNIVGMMAATLEATGFTKLYGYLRVDRHVLSLIQRVIKEDREADEALRRLPDLLYDKPTRADLTAEDIAYIQKAGHEIIERINCEYNLLAELERQYGVNFLEALTEKEKAAQKSG